MRENDAKRRRFMRGGASENLPFATGAGTGETKA